jgi:hypothetical protein
LALRGHQDSALGTPLSAKVNQWTLLVGSLPIAYAIGGGGAGGIALEVRTGFAIAYAALALSLLIWRRRELPRIARYASCSSSASTGSKLS